MTLNYDEGLKLIETAVWGESADDTRLVARLLLDISENLKIANRLKLKELQLKGAELSAEELTELGFPLA